MHSKRVLKPLVVVIALLTVVLACLCFGSGVLQFHRVADNPTELMHAASYGDVDTLKRLLDAGADINQRRGYWIRLGLFVAHGPERPRYGESALLFAINRRSLEAVRVLLNGGADVTVKDSAGDGIWEYALRNLGEEGSQVMLLLLQRLPLPTNIVDRVLYSATRGDYILLDFVLSHKPSADAREAALCNASTYGDVLSMDRLLQTFATPPPKAFDCAYRSWGNPGTSALGRLAVDYLVAYGADPGDKPIPISQPEELRYSCPLICIKSAEQQGCIGGCVLPSSGSRGDPLRNGYWIRGSGADGKMGKDGRFEITLRTVTDEKPTECSFVVDGRLLGPRTPVCDKAFGPIRITVMPQ